MSNELEKIHVYCECMNQVSASEELKEKIINKNIRGTKGRNLKAVYGIAAAAALFLVSNVSTYAVYGSTWVESLLNKSTVFCKSDEAVQKAQKENGHQPVYGAGHDLLGIYPEDTTVEKASVEEIYDLCFSVGEEQTLISDDTWQAYGKNYRKFVKTFSDRITKETYAAEDAADLVSFLPEVTRWDLSWLGEQYHPVEKGQILDIDRETNGNAILDAYLTGKYKAEDGKSLSLWFAYSCDEDYFNRTEYLNEKDFDYAKHYTTEDGVDIAIMGKGDEAAAQLSVSHYYLSFYGTNFSQEEMETVADHLDLGTLIHSLK